LFETGKRATEKDMGMQNLKGRDVMEFVTIFMYAYFDAGNMAHRKHERALLKRHVVQPPTAEAERKLGNGAKKKRWATPSSVQVPQTAIVPVPLGFFHRYERRSPVKRSNRECSEGTFSGRLRYITSYVSHADVRTELVAQFSNATRARPLLPGMEAKAPVQVPKSHIGSERKDFFTAAE